MYMLYLDEFGHEGIYDPTDTERQHSPIFGIGGVLVADNRWRELDRRYLALKRSFFAYEIELSGMRPERWEFKGTMLSTPSKQRNKRNQRFGVAVLKLLQSLGCTIIAKGKVKQSPAEHDATVIYVTHKQRVQGIAKWRHDTES